MPDETLDTPEESGYELEIPFVTVASKGGPHDDQAYVAGWEVGGLEHELAFLGSIASVPGTRIEIRRTLRTENLPQIDLAAMSHGFTVAIERADICEGHEDGDEWRLATFVKESE